MYLIVVYFIIIIIIIIIIGLVWLVKPVLERLCDIGTVNNEP